MKRAYFTVFGKKVLDKSGDVFHYPLQKKGDLLKFWLWLFLLPVFLVVIISGLFGYLLSSHPEQTVPANHIPYAGIHFLLLSILLLLMWVPQWLAIKEMSERGEKLLYALRSLILVGIVGLVLFPHNLVGRFVNKEFKEIDGWTPIFTLFSSRGWEARVYVIVFSLICLSVIILSIYQLYRTAYGDIRAGKPPRERKYVERLLWFDSGMFILIFLSLIVVELWVIAGTSNYLNTSRLSIGRKDPTYQFFEGYEERYHIRQDAQNARSQSGKNNGNHEGQELISPITERNMKLTAWFTGAVFSALLLLMWPFLANRLMKTILIPVTFHERDIRGIVLKSYRYLWHFYTAMLLKHPFLMLGGVSLTFIFLITPLIFVYAGRLDLLNTLIQPDQVILGIGVFLAWMSPLIAAIVRPDETFGEYFNHRIVNHLLMVQGHVAIIGFGSLGKRVLDRDVRLMRGKQLHEKIRVSHRTSRFLEVVTPDIRLEMLCSNAVVVEQDPRDLIFSGESSLIGTFGVVSTCQEIYKLRDVRGKVRKMENRILVPALVGQAQNPFTFSRGNLERSSLLISTISDWQGVQNIFEQAYQQDIKAIIAVSSSSHIFQFTHRARHRKIVLVYPRHNQGGTLGYRLWSAICKVRAHSGDAEHFPNVLVLGNNKANHFMLEALWALLPGDSTERQKIMLEHFRFVVATRGGAEGHPMLRDNPADAVFDRHWPTSFFAGSRPFFPEVTGGFPGNLHIETRVINEVDVVALEDCLGEQEPEIIVINHKNFEHSTVFVVRCIQALERLRIKKGKKQPLPIILLSTSQGSEREREVLGDISRYYDGLCQLYQAKFAGILDYPAHARYDHFVRELHGETVIDSLADTSEIIAGARRSFARDEENLKKDSKVTADFIEISACLPNRPAALANYLARLSRLKFTPVSWECLQEYWQENTPNEVDKIWLPSFQYLRHSKLDDPESRGFVVTGYATLCATVADSPLLTIPADDQSLVARIFANDGEQYVEEKVDPLEGYPRSLAADNERRLRNIRKKVKPGPGVPEVIARVARRTEDHKTIDEFTAVLTGSQVASKSPLGCPAMNLCRIATFQNFITATNNQRLNERKKPDLKEKYPADQVERLWQAHNYGCCKEMLENMSDMVEPTTTGPYARIFLCCNGEDRSGLMATVLNILLFRRKPTRQVTFRLSEEIFEKHAKKFRPRHRAPIKAACRKMNNQAFTDPQEFYAAFQHHLEHPGLARKYQDQLLEIAQQPEDNWRINIDYFSDISCQNAFFALNRLFGVFETKPLAGKIFNPVKNAEKSAGLQLPAEDLNPINIIRVLPIGGLTSARLWYEYMRALLNFVQKLEPGQFKFYWYNEQRQRREENQLPDFTRKEGQSPRNYPVLIVIKRRKHEQKKNRKKTFNAKLDRQCQICRQQKVQHDCSRMRAWI